MIFLEVLVFVSKEVVDFVFIGLFLRFGFGFLLDVCIKDLVDVFVEEF